MLRVDYNNFSDVITAVRRQYPATHQLQIAFNDFVVDVRINNKALQKKLLHYFAEFIVNSPKSIPHSTVTVHDAPPLNFPYNYKRDIPKSPHKPIKLEWVELGEGRIVRHCKTNIHYLLNEKENCIVGPCFDQKNKVVNFINSRFIKHQVDRDYLLGHAAGVNANGRGIIISGNSGAGKSTLALHLVTCGANFVSNDRVVINNKANAHFFGTLQHPRINPGTVLNNPNLKNILTPEEHRKFSRIDTEALWQLEYKYDALIPECFGPARFVPKAPLSAVAILDWRRCDAPMSIGCLTAQEASHHLSNIIKKNDVLYLPRNKNYTVPTIHDYTAALANTPIFIIRGGVDFSGATHKLMNFLRTGSTGT